MSSQQSKRPAICINPLSDGGLLTRVLDLAGPAHWLFLGAVCNAWRDAYAEIVEAAMRQLDSERTHVAGVCDCKRHTHGGKYTAHSAVFASASCVREAHNAGFRFDLESAAKTAGHYVDSDTLLQAHQLGMPYSDVLCQGIVERGDPAVMKWIEQQEPAVITDLLDDGTIMRSRRYDRPGRANFESLFPSSDFQSSSLFEPPGSTFPGLLSSNCEHPQAALPLFSSPTRLPTTPRTFTNRAEQSNASVTPMNTSPCPHFPSPSFFNSACDSRARASAPATPRKPSKDSPNHDHELSRFSRFGDTPCSPPMKHRFGPRRLNMVPAAIRSGNLELLLWLLQRGAKLSKDSLQQAAAAGHLHMVMYTIEQYMHITSAYHSVHYLRTLQSIKCQLCASILAYQCVYYLAVSSVRCMHCPL
jgi:hypothetical protein